MCALVSALERGEAVDAIPGLVYRENGSIAMNDPVPCAPAAIAAAARPKRLVDYYVNRSRVLNVQTQRGCAYRCCYCTYPLIEGREVRRRSPGEVADELEQAASLGAHYFWIVDSVFNLSPEHVSAVCEEILARRLRVHWGCFLRPQGITAEIMGLMARSGLRHIEFGPDSLCDTVLDAYGKDLTFDDILSASECARAHDVRYAHFVILGGPGESESTIREGFANADRLRETVVFPSVGMRVYPGTPLCRTAFDQGAVEATTGLLDPVYYLAPGMSAERIYELIAERSGRGVRWAVDEPQPGTLETMKRLRQIGVEGPLWEFLIA
jgi:radical SAM superfamily enzyme YgiQ (UPF0313 family)